MKITELISILIRYNEKFGDVEVTGACSACENGDMEVSVLTDDFNKTVEILVEEGE